MAHWLDNPVNKANLTAQLTKFAQNYNGDFEKYFEHVVELDMYEEACGEYWAALQPYCEEAGQWPDAPTNDLMNAVEKQIFGTTIDDEL
jgi:hypothetical protein